MKRKKPEKNELIQQRLQQRCQLHDLLVGMAVILTEWFYEEDLQLKAEYREQRFREFIADMLGSREQWGALQYTLNHVTDGILDRLEHDFPRFSPEQVLIFSYSAVGFTNELSAKLAGLSCSNYVSVMKSRMRTAIQYSRSPYKEEYLVMLPEKSCRIGEEMLYLHNCSNIIYGISEKNQNQSPAHVRAGTEGAGKRMGPHQEG